MVSQSRDELLCPKCGAPLPASAARATVVCGFCGVLSTPAAPKVIERVVERVVVVQAQGAGASSAPLVGTTPVCPRCAAPLFEGQTGEIVLHGCGACGGIWLDNEATRRVVEEAPAPVADLAERAERHAISRPDTRPAGMPCPVCRGPLARVRVARGAVDLDVCASHGTWFDRHELVTVVEAMRAPSPGAVGRGIPSEEELARVAAAGATDAERAAFADYSDAASASMGQRTGLERTAERTAIGVTIGLLGAVLGAAAGGSRS